MRRLALLLALLIAAPLSAATPVFLEPGTDSTQDLTFYASTAGTCSSDSTVSFTGPRSLKCNTGAGPTTASVTTKTGVLADAGTRINFNLQLSSLPAGTGNILVGQTSAGGAIWNLQVTTTGALRMAGATAVTGTTTLTANTWNRVTVSYTITDTTHFRFDFFLNGILQGSMTAGSLASTVSSKMLLVSNTAFGASVSAWFDNIYVDNGSDYSDPGDIRLTSKRPNANGTTTGFTTQIGSGGSGYGTGHSPQVNEQPLSQTNGWSMVGAGSAITEEYNVENAATGDVSTSGHSVLGVMGWVFGKSASSETGSIVVDGTSSNISLTSTATFFFAISATPTTYPAGTGTDIGIITSTTVTTVSLYECGIVVAYAPYGAVPASQMLFR